jgi:AraC-like DNA-binding protein
MLRETLELKRDGVEVADVACRHRCGPGHDIESGRQSAVIFVRRGCFVRSADGVETLLDPTVAYCMNAGEEERYDHPHDHGDDCTAIRLAPELLASVWSDPERLPPGPLPVSPQVDLAHRRMLAVARRRDDPHGAVEHAIGVVADLLRAAVDRGTPSHSRQTTRMQARLVADARESLTEDPDRSLIDLAAAVSASPHHLSRLFRAHTGTTIARQRMRLRVRDALERLAGGEADLGRLAADTGFADHAHLCRTFRAELGRTPSAVRAALT